MLVRTARFRDLDNATLYALLWLRCDVFVVEQRCAYRELDGRDVEPETVHAWVDHQGAPVACLRILRESDGYARIGRVVTAAAHRGAGHASRLMTSALSLIGPDACCVLEAQAHLVEFYARFGFVPVGAEYLEDGIPHVSMRRLRPSTRH